MKRRFFRKYFELFIAVWKEPCSPAVTATSCTSLRLQRMQPLLQMLHLGIPATAQLLLTTESGIAHHSSNGMLLFSYLAERSHLRLHRLLDNVLHRIC
jgi:hypothetical protein